MRSEYRVAVTQLTPQNRRTLHRMARYIDSYALNEVAFEELMSDLVGMALECQKRNQPFSEAVGMDEAAFCHELVANCPRRTSAECVFGMLLFFAAWVAVVLPAMYLLEWWFPWMPGSCDGLAYLAPASFLCKYFATVLMLSVGMYFWKRITYRSKPLVGSVYVLLFLLVFITVSEVSPWIVGQHVLRIHIVVWVLVCAAVILSFYAARRCVAMTMAYQRKKQELRAKSEASGGSADGNQP